MIIIPAIDLQNGEAVRLYKGDYAQKTVYSREPVQLAKQFEQMGVKYLHIVDLDGAKKGVTVNRETIAEIRKNIAIPIQVGGGIRDSATVEYYLNELKIDRVIIGTAAIQNPRFLREVISKHGPEQIVAGVDMRDGKVATSGWLETSNINYLSFINDLTQIGIKYIVATDIAKDGTLTSPNWEMYRTIHKLQNDLNIIVAGGVSSDEDIMRGREYYGVIVGKAYYEGKVDLERCIKNV
jgi:phosphoribosylformimino-5-aminoimidazole carboxamide ribotide isomerase